MYIQGVLWSEGLRGGIMLQYQASMLRDEAREHKIRCKTREYDGVWMIELGKEHKLWLSYWYAVMDLWELEYKREGVEL